VLRAVVVAASNSHRLDGDVPASTSKTVPKLDSSTPPIFAAVSCTRQKEREAKKKVNKDHPRRLSGLDPDGGSRCLRGASPIPCPVVRADHNKSEPLTPPLAPSA